MLHKIVRANRLAWIFKILYWLVILGIALGTYYYIQPLLLNMLDLYQSMLGGVQNIQKAGSAASGVVETTKTVPLDLISRLKDLLP